MSMITVIAFCVGLALGGSICALGVQGQWRKVRQETTDQMKRSLEIQDGFYSAAAMGYLVALQKLEAGDTEASKRELASSAATFYRYFGGRGQVTPIVETQKRDIEDYAKRSPLLRAALQTQADAGTAQSNN